MTTIDTPPTAAELVDAFHAEYSDSEDPRAAFARLAPQFVPQLAADPDATWDAYATVYLPTLESQRPYCDMNARVRSELQVQPGQAAVDIGCGPGGVWKGIDTPVSVTGIDGSAAMLREANKNVSDIVTHQHNFNQPFTFVDSHSADRMTCLNALSFVADEEKADQLVGEIARIIRPTGRLVITISRQGYSGNLVWMRDYEQETGQTQNPADWRGTDLDRYAWMYERVASTKTPEVRRAAMLFAFCNAALRQQQGATTEKAASFEPSDDSLRQLLHRHGFQIETDAASVYADQYVLFTATPAERARVAATTVG